MPLISLDKVTLGHGAKALLDGVDLQIDAKERVCLIGRNGAGKSTLMRLIGGEVAADDGTIWRQPGLRMAHLAQDVPLSEEVTVFDVVAGGLDALGDLLSRYHHLAQRLANESSDALFQQLAKLQHELETADGWRLEQRVETVLSRFGLPPDRAMSHLSGGMRRRVLLARALVTEPELLLLDEPTNHLDIEAITWLEEFLLGYDGALLFITHDRRFLERLATRIVELDRGRLVSWPGDYQTYLRKKQEQLEVEARHNAEFDKKLAQEEAWIRQGIKARRTRNEGRVRALQALREDRRQRRELQGKANINLDAGESSGKLVVEAEHVTVGYDGRPVLKDFSTRIMRGDRVGIIGPNGSGKTTLLKTLLGRLKPGSGTVRLGTKLQVAYFDQQREVLNLETSVLENLNHGKDMVTVNGHARHVISYLQDFLFSPERARAPVKTLSGGERNRLLLARLFTQPANLLVMDEPTNDLDVETLELLEEVLAEYQGTLLLVSHDRAFLDNVVTSTLVLEGDGRVGEYVGGYEDWLRQRPAPVVEKPPLKSEPKPRPQVAPEPVKARKLSYKEQRELAELPERIEALEAEQAELQTQINRPDFYQQDKETVTAALARLESLSAELEQVYERWGELDG